ncbi:MAG: type II secretion system protein [Candidatus Gastranaerophilales bacterium]|nr:type II secretion system protein [Candidatus Gastranaerophilales bacterium]
MDKKAFTLAEVLITLVIIGVIAALTIPSLLNDTNDKEIRTGVKKAYSMLSQAQEKEYSESGQCFKDIRESCADSNCLFENFYKKHFNIISTTAASSATACSNIGGDFGDGITFYTADGMAFSPKEDLVIVDVNGDKKPNTITHSGTDLKDSFVFVFERNTNSNGEEIHKVTPIPPAVSVIKDIDCNKIKSEQSATAGCGF